MLLKTASQVPSEEIQIPLYKSAASSRFTAWPEKMRCIYFLEFPSHLESSCHLYNNNNQWRIQDFPEGGAWTLQGGREHAKFSRKLHEIERIWTPRGGRASLTPPLDPPMTTILGRWRSVSAMIKSFRRLALLTHNVTGQERLIRTRLIRSST